MTAEILMVDPEARLIHMNWYPEFVALSCPESPPKSIDIYISKCALLRFQSLVLNCTLQYATRCFQPVLVGHLRGGSIRISFELDKGVYGHPIWFLQDGYKASRD